jgi:hypothetical protein
VASIIVVADTDAGDARGFQLKERVSAALLDDPHFSSQLIERIGWALADAEETERAGDGSSRYRRLRRRPGGRRWDVGDLDGTDGLTAGGRPGAVVEDADGQRPGSCGAGGEHAGRAGAP